jgi:hypothetical protein
MSDYGDEVYGVDTYGETASQTHLPDKWIERTRANIEAVNNHQTYRFFEAWQKSEGGTAKWNPLNTTLDLGTQWTEGNYNSIGVKNYKYAIVGIVAIALTLNQRKADGSLMYATLLSNLRNSSLTAEQIVNASRADIQLWGTNPDTMLNVLKSIA